jgi:hypothetical protein
VYEDVVLEVVVAAAVLVLLFVEPVVLVVWKDVVDPVLLANIRAEEFIMFLITF